jgi:hypothetical protein
MKTADLLVALAVLAALVRAAPEPCKSGCLCDTGAAKTVPDIWPNASGVLCNPQTKTCEVCGDCNQIYPKCPCCNPLLVDAASCLNCRVANSAACGNPAVSYSCDQAQGQCVPKTGGGGAYPTKAACDTACVSDYFVCEGGKCLVTPKGTPGAYANKTACEGKCSAPAPTPAPAPTSLQVSWVSPTVHEQGGAGCASKTGVTTLKPDGEKIKVHSCTEYNGGITMATFCTLTENSELKLTLDCESGSQAYCGSCQHSSCEGKLVTTGCSVYASGDPDAKVRVAFIFIVNEGCSSYSLFAICVSMVCNSSPTHLGLYLQCCFPGASLPTLSLPAPSPTPSPSSDDDDATVLPDLGPQR